MWRQGLAFAIYDLIARFSHAGGAYFSSLTALADYFGASYDSVHQAVQWLLKNGWIEVVGHAPPTVVEDREGLRMLRKHKSRSKNYRVIRHDTWAVAHPNQCATMLQQPWDDEEKDPLAVELYKYSYGKTKWYPNMLAGLRSSGLGDLAIVKEWVKYYNTLPKKPATKKAWDKTRFEFIKRVKEFGSQPENAAGGVA
jgi:hypothetical protein